MGRPANADKQIRDNINSCSVSAVVGAVVEGSGQTRVHRAGKKIISTCKKFPFILDEIGNEHRGRRFAIISIYQPGRTAARCTTSRVGEEEESIEDIINRVMKSRKMLPNAGYFAFTATPKNKTLQLFGDAYPVGDKIGHRPFHSYTMKQAIQEGFILDVLRTYTPVGSYYRLVKTVESDPLFDSKKAQAKLRRYVESNDHAIRRKSEIMVDHFHDQVLAVVMV